MIIARPIGVCSPLPIVKDPNGPGIDASSITSGTIDAARMYVAIDTYANIVANYAAASYSGCKAFATDLGGFEVISKNSVWSPIHGQITVAGPKTKRLIIGANGASYVQSGNQVAVTWTAHGLHPTAFNGAKVYLPAGSTGGLLAGWYNNFQRTSADAFTCESATSQNISGNLSTNTAEVFPPDIASIPGGMLYPFEIESYSCFVRAKSSANNKVGKLYVGDYNAASVTVTNGDGATAWSQANQGNRVIVESSSELTQQFITSYNTTYTGNALRYSGQCASANDWICLWFERLRLIFTGDVA